MFYNDVSRMENRYQPLFNFRLIGDIKKEKVDLSSSEVLSNDDFVIIKLRNKDDEYCPVDIYLGINKSANRYSLYLNEKAIVYNYERFETYELFEKELQYFLSNQIQATIVSDKNDVKVYTDYIIASVDGKSPLSFREYHKDNWSNFLGLKKVKKRNKNYSPWL